MVAKYKKWTHHQRQKIAKGISKHKQTNKLYNKDRIK